MTAVLEDVLPSRAEMLARLARAERGDGWMASCVDDGSYLALTAPFIDALFDAIVARLRASSAEQEPLLEVCAGDGQLAAALRARGVAIVATDVAPPAHASEVQRMTARQALDHYQPRIVLGAFVPHDSRVDASVLQHESVRHYVVLNARLGTELGSHHLWTEPDWQRSQLHEVSSEMVTRHDAWMSDDAPVRRHGEAWLLNRATDPNPPRSRRTEPNE